MSKRKPKHQPKRKAKKRAKARYVHGVNQKTGATRKGPQEDAL